MPQENISFSQLFKANATSPQLPEIYIYRTAILQRALTFSGLFNLPIPVPILDVCARLAVGRLETGGSIFSMTGCAKSNWPTRLVTPYQARVKHPIRTPRGFKTALSETRAGRQRHLGSACSI